MDPGIRHDPAALVTHLSYCGMPLVVADGRLVPSGRPADTEEVVDASEFAQGLVARTARALDQRDRSHPLEHRALPGEYEALAHDQGSCALCFREAVLAACAPAAPPRLTKDEMKRFVWEWLSGNVWSNMHVPAAVHLVEMQARGFVTALDDLRREAAEQAKMCFPLLHLAPSMPDDYKQHVAFYWQLLSEARSTVAEMPCFLTYRTMHADDWAVLREAISKAAQVIEQPFL